ncbi:MAG: 30S ribosomal protein S20 [Polyangia bacterium]
MANHPQAKKRNRQRIKRTARNRYVRSTMRTAVKAVRKAIEAGDGAAARESMKTARCQLDRSVTRGVLKRKTASRTISRLDRAVNTLSTG